jgi:hypothetical protein
MMVLGGSMERKREDFRREGRQGQASRKPAVDEAEADLMDLVRKLRGSLKGDYSLIEDRERDHHHDDLRKEQKFNEPFRMLANLRSKLKAKS